MNEIEQEIHQSLNLAAKSVIMNPHLESRAWNQITSNLKTKKHARAKRGVTIGLLLSVILIVGTAYAESNKSKIKLLAFIGHVPIFSKQNATPSSVNPELEQEKRLASDRVFNENKVGRVEVEGMSPVPLILPTLPKGYELTEEYGIQGKISQRIREGKLEKTWLQKDGTFTYLAWIDLKDGAVLTVHNSGPESYNSKIRNDGLKEILKKLNLK